MGHRAAISLSYPPIEEQADQLLVRRDRRPTVRGGAGALESTRAASKRRQAAGETLGARNLRNPRRGLKRAVQPRPNNPQRIAPQNRGERTNFGC